jgi:hypothetical protein
MADMQFVNPYSGRVAALQQALVAAQNREIPPAFTPEEIQQRQAENRRQEMLGTLAQLSGDRVAAPVGERLLKMALAERQKRVTDRGEYDPMTGRYQLHPEVRRAQELDAIERQMQQAAMGEARAEEQWNRDRARAEEQRALRMTMAAIGAANRQAAGPAMVGTWQYTGNTPEGAPILFNNKTGAMATTGPEGLQPYGGAAPMKREEYGKKVTEQAAAQAALGNIRGVIKQVEDNPEAFSTWKGVVQNALPEFARGAAGLGLWTEQQRQIRANIAADAAIRINELIGAAQTETERQGLLPFIVQQSDPPEAALSKLRAAESLASQKLRGLPKVGPPAGPYGGTPQPSPGAPLPGVPAGAPPSGAPSSALPAPVGGGLPPGVTVRQIR